MATETADNLPAFLVIVDFAKTTTNVMVNIK
jgi:hypothetical protein